MKRIDSKYKDIWNKAFQYQDARNDRGHAFIVTVYAQGICDNEKVDKDVVVPAAILHDIGWSQMTKPERMLIFDKSTPKEERLKMRYKHQREGVRLAKIVLGEVKYTKELVEEILEIISEHDTRKGFVSANEGAMRDADKLSRFDEHGFLDDNQNSAIIFEKHFRALEEYLEMKDFFYFESSKKLAEKKLTSLKNVFSD